MKNNESIIIIPQILQKISAINPRSGYKPCSECQETGFLGCGVSQCGICESMLQCSGCKTECDVCQNGCQGNSCEGSCENGGCQANQCHICEELCEVTKMEADKDGPGPATRITVQKISRTSIEASWEAVKPAADFYTIFYTRITSDGREPHSKKVDLGLSTIIDGLIPDSDYLINYRGENDDGKKGATLTPSVSFDTKRPADWEWQSLIKKNEPIKLTASEFRDFFNRINEFRSYKGIESYNFIFPEFNSEIKADICNQAIDAIAGVYGEYNEIPGHGELPSKVKSQESLISADYFILLKNALNKVQ